MRPGSIVHPALVVLLLGAAPCRAGEPEADALRFLRAHCTSCHDEEKARGDLSLEGFAGAASVLEDPRVWGLVKRRVEAREMPPPGRARPSDEELSAFLGWVAGELERAERLAPPDPGRVTIRRLNRTEYSNTVRDMLGVSYPVDDRFPADDVGYGFDNIGDVLTLSPLLLEKYLAAAEAISAEALRPGTETRERILVCVPPAEGRRDRGRCRRKVLERLAGLAYRRPPTREEVDRLARLARGVEDDGGAFEDGIRTSLEALLVSPHFLFRVEIDPRPDDPKAIHAVSDFELASRLSYFLWSTLPDEELFALAREGKLRDPETLDAQARRMLRDPRSRALVESFAPQWLQIRRLRTASPDRRLFGSFDDRLRESMLKETALFFEALVREDRSVLDLLDGRFTFVDERLARHYGIPGVEGDEFRRVDLAGTPRGGVLTHASVLASTSNPTRTSPVKRGKWVLEVLLGRPPPPPPPAVPELDEAPDAVLSGTLRQRMEQHRAKPECATCHVTMDPLGFGLENFDAVGAWRDRDGEFSIDPSGELPDGRRFSGPVELRALLLGEKASFRRALAETLLVYALGRGAEPHDEPSIRKIVESLERDGDRFSALVLAIVRSEPFLKRRGDRGTP